MPQRRTNADMDLPAFKQADAEPSVMGWLRGIAGADKLPVVPRCGFGWPDPGHALPWDWMDIVGFPPKPDASEAARATGPASGVHGLLLS